MVELVTETEHVDGITFIRAIVTNTHRTPQFVQIRNELDGPAWIPQHGENGAPAWEGNLWELAIDPGSSVGFGLASPTDPVDEPLTITDVRRAPDETSRTPEQVLVSLDEAKPPRMVVETNR